MKQEDERARLRARRVFLQDRAAAVALLERVYPRRFRRAQARHTYYLSTYYKR